MPFPFPFSSRTLGHLVEAIASGYTHASMRTLFLKAQVENWNPGEGSKETVAQELLFSLRNSGSKEANDGVHELARLVLAEKADGWGNPSSWWTSLKDAVAADGWEFDEETGHFIPLVPGAPLSEETSWLEDELHRRGWSVAAGHYQQAIENFAGGNWAAANGQLRSFYESLTSAAADNAPASGPGQVQVAFDLLDSRGLLLPDEAAFGKSLWRLLHPNGSHPGLSDEDESRFRLLTLTGYTRFLLTRLPD